MQGTWPLPPRPDSSTALLRAATLARAHAETLDAPDLRSRLEDLAWAAESGGDSRFQTELAAAAPALLGFLLGFEIDGSPPGLLRAYGGDAFGRFLHTLELTPRPVTGSILEIGANPYLFHLLLRAVFANATLVGSNFFDHDIFSTKVGTARHRLRNEHLGEVIDFEFPTFNLETVHPYPFPPGSFELVYFCETLEHLVVNPLRVFRELRRILRPGGHLVVTLPNAVRLTNVAAMLAGRNFFDLYQEGNGVHGRHNREFTLAEIRTLLERDGFEIVRAETRDRFDYDSIPIEAVDYSGPPARLPWRKADLEERLRSSGGTTDNRGDNIYVVARRPTETRTTTAPPGRATAAPVGSSSVLADDERLVSFLDLIEETHEGLRVTGWAFFTDDVSGLPCEAEIVLRGQDRTVRHRAEAMSRPDVATAHGLDLNAVGFTALVPRSGLPGPGLDVLLRLRRADGATAERPLGRWGSAPAPDGRGSAEGEGTGGP